MSILVDRKSRVMVQGITGEEGLFYTRLMLQDQTNLVSGVNPGRGGEWVLNDKIPVFDTVQTAVEVTGANVSIIFISARYAPDAIIEAVDAGISLIVCATEGVPNKDVVRILAYVNGNGARLLGPGSPGVVTPGEASVGVLSPGLLRSGHVGVVSRFSFIAYEVLYEMKKEGIGVSTFVGLGDEHFIGTSMMEVLEMFEQDIHTEQVVMIGELGGVGEAMAAEFVARQMKKPVVSLFVGKSAPPGLLKKKLGFVMHPTTVSPRSTIDLLESGKVLVAETPAQVADLLKVNFIR